MSNLLTRKEIGLLVNQSPQVIGKYIERRKLVEKNKRIDTDNSKNKAFLSKFITKEVLQAATREESDNTEKSPKTSKGINQGNIDYVIKQHDLKLKIIKIKKENLDYDKKKAKLIEIVAASDVMQRSVVVLSSQYRQGAKQFVTLLAAKYEIPVTDLAGIQKKFDDSINKAVKESKDLIKSECEIIANEYSNLLNIGESKS